ncbi:MAG: transcriptional regulator [Marinitoga sp. 4572_148]|nr:MAG: transcriptional regulator [Marinitoga sp. 4572_148]
MRTFCTSGPVDKKTCYYVKRPDIMAEALNHIENWRYFTVSAPRQSGKTTLLRDIVEKIKDKYITIFLSFEDYKNMKTEEEFIETFYEEIIEEAEKYNITLETKPQKIRMIKNIFEEIYKKTGKEVVLLIDEFEKLNNEEIMNTLLHVIRKIDYMDSYIDKNIANILHKAEKERDLIMKILFEPEEVKFSIYDERISYLYLHGLIDNCGGKCCIRVPLYYKALYARFKPKINGEKRYIINIYENLSKYFTKEGKLKINELMKKYIEYINKRGAVMFKGKKLYEGVYQYNLDIFLSTYMEELGGEVLTEVEVGGGRIDLLVRYKEEKYLIEIKRNPGPRKFQLAKKQLVEYLKRSGLKEGWLVIYSDAIEDFKHEIEEIDGVKINVWFIKTNFENPSKVN